MTVRKDRYTTVPVRLPNEVVARLRAIDAGKNSFYRLVQNLLTTAAEGNALDCAFTSEEFSRLDVLARTIGFASVSELVRHLALSYLKLYTRECGVFDNEVLRDEIRELFVECESNAEHYEEGIAITTTPRKIRGV